MEREKKEQQRKKKMNREQGKIKLEQERKSDGNIRRTRKKELD